MRILKSATEMLGGNDFTFCVKKVLDGMCPEELESVAKKLKVKNTYNITQKAREIKETFSTEALDDVMVEIDLYGVDDDLFNGELERATIMEAYGELLQRYTAFVESFFHSVATDRWCEA